MNTAVITIILFNGSLLLHRHLWGVDLGWAPGAHQAALSLPFPVGQGRENEMENDLYVEIKQFIKAKAEDCMHINKKKRRLILYFPQQVMFSYFLGSSASSTNGFSRMQVL